MKRLLLFFVSFALSTAALLAQGSFGEVQGRVVDEKNEGIPFANVVVSLNGIQVNGAATDFDGYFSIKPLDPGKYQVVASYLGKTVTVNNVAISPGKTTFLDNILINTSEAQVLQTVVVEYKEPAVDVGKPEVGTTVTREEIEKMPRNNLVGILNNAAATYQSDDNSLISIAGARGYGTKYLIDGVDLTGIVDLPTDAIDQVNVITSGVDASQGDFTGGLVSVSTRGPSNRYNGTAEFFTSQFLDPFGYNEARASVLGPLIRTNKGTDSVRSVVGFLLTGLYRQQKDSDPAAVEMWTVTDDVLAELKQNPLRPSRLGEGLVKSTEFIRMDDMQLQAFRPNNGQREINLFGKLDIKPSLNTNLTIGSSFYLNERDAYIRTYQMFNYENNPTVYNNDFRVYGKFRQNFVANQSRERRTGYTLDNAYYTIIVDYQRIAGGQEDRNHGRDPFRYGYVGNFDTYREPVYFYSVDSVTGNSAYRLFGYRDTAVTYTPGTANPVLSRYTEQYYDVGDPNNLFDILLGGGLRNGDFTQSLFAYSLWYNPGVPFTNYQNFVNDQFGARFDASFDLKKSSGDKINRHSIQFGFEYQQRIESVYSVSPYGLWGLARQNTNFHIFNLDLNNPYYLINGTPIWYQDYTADLGAYDTIFYNRLYNQSEQRYFDVQLRNKLGLPVDGLDFINIDAVDPSLLTLDMFSPDELLNAGNRFVNAIGFDYYGNRITNQPSFADFFYDFNDVNGNGERDFGEVFTRNIAAYRLIYTAAYMQDRFNIGRVIFRVGLRVDRFDANMPVLRDKYSLYRIRSAGEVSQIGGANITHPGSIGEDFAVYVNDIQNPSEILGYRDGDEWYDSEGNLLADPRVLVTRTGGAGQIQPYLVDPTQNIKSATNFDVDQSFVDYTPQLTAMPRIAFSFPITETAMFTAHYDVLAQRPLSNNEANPYHYFFLQEIAIDGVIPNPDLRPERTINYQLGFQQALSEDSRLSISAFYREMRDMMQVQRVLFAYPIEYTTFGNIDFGTVKGLSLSYDLIRRVNNILLNANYTLQFADGTGSNTTSQLNLVGAGQPNLRTIVPLDQDVRHTFNVNLDYRFAGGREYNGPTVGGRDIFANTGINFAFRGRTGEPYTRQANPTPTAQFGVANRSFMQGTINGSRLPFNYKLDIRIDKDFVLNSDGAKPLFLNIYFVSQNLLNTRNIVGVYRFTGSATDDGYLASPEAEEVLRAQLDRQAFLDQYLAKVSNPSNFAQPRRMQIGAKLRF